MYDTTAAFLVFVAAALIGVLVRVTLGSISNRAYLRVAIFFVIGSAAALVFGPTWAWYTVAAAGLGLFCGTTLALPSRR